MKKANFIKEASGNQTNPILKFRSKQQREDKKKNVKNGTQEEKNDILLNTMITETREQIDTTENS